MIIIANKAAILRQLEVAIKATFVATIVKSFINFVAIALDAIELSSFDLLCDVFIGVVVTFHKL